MGYVLKRARILGFRGTRDIDIKFDRNLNFLIGINGSGKTTIINIIKDSIALDNSLRSMPADRVEIVFQNTGKSDDKSSNPHLSILKNDNGSPFKSMKILYKANQDEDYTVIHDDEQAKRQTSKSSHRFHSRRLVPLNMYSKEIPVLSNVDYSWFSIQRKEKVSRNEWEDDFEDAPENPLDVRINTVASETASYFFEMDAISRQLSSQFQKDYFQIMTRFYGTHDVKDMELELGKFEEKMALILNELEIYNDDMANNIRALLTVLSGDEGSDRNNVSIDRAIALSTVKKMNEIITKWNHTQSKVEKNYSPKTEFLEVINSFLNGKKMNFKADNSPVFNIQENVHSSKVLSSGEKQLLIFMMAALNQRQKSHIFIADEPELSLHVDWQEMLVSKIMKLNPAAQIIFATHSPDIVGDNGGKIVDLSI